MVIQFSKDLIIGPWSFGGNGRYPNYWTRFSCIEGKLSPNSDEVCLVSISPYQTVGLFNDLSFLRDYISIFHFCEKMEEVKQRVDYFLLRMSQLRFSVIYSSTHL
jgi:hypothetical protein